MKIDTDTSHCTLYLDTERQCLVYPPTSCVQRAEEEVRYKLLTKEHSRLKRECRRKNLDIRTLEIKLIDIGTKQQELLLKTSNLESDNCKIHASLPDMGALVAMQCDL